MWMINCLLLIIGTVAGVCGISFYIRNREAVGRLRFYIFAYGICSAVWCIFFALIGICDDFGICSLFRKIGDIGIVSFLIAETFLGADMCGLKEKTAGFFKALSIVLGVVDYLFYAQDKVSTFVRIGNRTTWIANPEGSFNRAIHSAYIAVTFIVLFSFVIVWYRNNKVKRLRRFLRLFIISNYLMLFFTIPDTFLPIIGQPAVATSGIGAALCAIVIWYGATRLGSFDIRMGNLRDKMFDFMEVGVVVMDTDKKIVLLNRYADNRMEYSKSCGKPIWEYMDISEAEALTLLDASVSEIQTVQLRNANRSKVYSIRLSAVKDNFGEVFCFLCVFVDVTEEVKAVTKYEIASRAKSRFLAQMSHEIRTPINAVLGMNEMILRESEDANILEYAGNIDSAGKTLLSLINSILDFSKIEDGKMEIVPVRYDTVSLINDLYHSIVQRADAKGLELVTDVDETLPCALIGDDVRISQVIMNLLTNAVKYTEKGSVTLSIRAAGRNEGRVKLSVSVRDTGIGIRQDDMGRLFESFERLDEVRNHNIEGTGLGISIIKSLLDMMGSELKVESEYGVGSVFSFMIEQDVSDETPIGDYGKRQKESRAHRDEEVVIHAPDARILVVDDNDMNRKVARNLLKLCGIKPDEAGSGTEAIGLMRRNIYDIVFLDHMMPGMDGIETLHRLEEEKLVPGNTVMIALTANAVVGARETYLAEGFKDYISKPIEFKHLMEKLQEYLPERAYGDSGMDNPPDGVKSDHHFPMESSSEGDTDIMEYSSEGDTGIMEFEAGGEEIFEFGLEDENSTRCCESGARSAKYDVKRLEEAGIDVSAGLRYCADDETLYFEMLDEFLASCEGKLRETERLLADEDLHGYEVAVHAFKSNVKMIGAMSVYEEAGKLEEAAERGDTQYIRQQHGGMNHHARELTDAIRQSIG